MSVIHNNPLEEALDKLDLKGTILLLTVLSQRALYLKDHEDTQVNKILTPLKK